MSIIPGWLNGSAPIPTVSGNLIPQLSQYHTNGGNTLGTLDFGPLPRFLEGPRQNGSYPWGNASVYTVDTTYPPNTGVTRYYDLTITNTTLAPDGFSMPVLAVNGQYPAPLIEANWGDWIEVKVNNQLVTEGTSMHWHGLLQRDTAWYDGVPGISQCPLAPNTTFTYRFRADQPGATWYHSHYSGQYTGAIQGPLVIHGPTSADYDVDLGPLLMNDWFHDNYNNLIAQTMAPNVEGGTTFFWAENILMNGKMNYNCTIALNISQPITPNYTCTNDAGVAKFKFQSGKRHLLRLANTGAESIIKFSVDNHNLTVISVDFTPTQPYTTDLVTLVVGQRTEVIIEATGQSTDAVWMRAATSPNCSDVGGIYLTGLAAAFYEDANTTAMPTSLNTVVTKEMVDVCDNDPLDTATPAYNGLAEAGINLEIDEPDYTLDVRCTLGFNGTHNVWYINNSTFRDDYNDPLLLDAKAGNLSTVSPQRNLYNAGQAHTVRLVIYNYMALASHPMHLHGHNFWVLATGHGEWDGSMKSTFVNPQNPQRRDTCQVRKAVPQNVTRAGNDFEGTPSYVVIQYVQDNPGVWPMHCHIAWHVSDGFLMNIMERPDDIRNEMQIPAVMAQTCRDWAAWTGGHVVPMIDGGL